MLTRLQLPVVMDTSSSDLIADLFVPALKESVRYDRGVGYFSSGWLRIAAKGMAALAANGGKARWITSPILAPADWDVMQRGVAARQDALVRQALERSITDLERELERDTLSALAWMVADNILEFRLAIPMGKLDGDFHDKFGIFTDTAGQQVAFSGSYNESIQGTRNYESLKVFCSWKPEYAPLVDADARRFERLWDHGDPNVRVVSLPEAARQQLVQLRTDQRPYPDPRRLAAEVSGPRRRLDRPLRPYQEEAIAAWFAHSCRGFLEMATGTGKTITALSAAVDLYKREGRLAIVIAAPYQHLVDQWRDECVSFGLYPVLAYAARQRWQPTLHQQIAEYNRRDRAIVTVIATHSTFGGEAFQSELATLTGPSLFIADEAHHLGAERSSEQLPASIPYRLALSATPDRWFDEEGTDRLRGYFGPTVYSFPLEKAIGVSLTPYYYYPHLVELTPDELIAYQDLSIKIYRLLGNDDERTHETLQMLLIKRANLLNNAENKLACLARLMVEEPDLHHALFYCAPEQIDEVVALLGRDRGLRVHTFTAHETMKDRRRLLDQFASGELQGLVAIRCLDEGVDVPATRTAYILASSSNPREFIQRRGRILRMSPGKEVAAIHDLIAAPPLSYGVDLDDAVFAAERSIVRREVQRFTEFANTARNKHQAIDEIWPLVKAYGLIDL